MTASHDGDRPNDRWKSMTTQRLVDHAARGDELAIQALHDRLRPRLTRFAHGKLPASARDLCNTADLVQDVLSRSLTKVVGFEQDGGGVFAYLCTGIRNAVRNEVRRTDRRPPHGELGERLVALHPSPLDSIVGQETEERYLRALERLPANKRDLICMRLDLEMSFQEIALELGLPSGDAARMQVNRAITKLAETLGQME